MAYSRENLNLNENRIDNPMEPRLFVGNLNWQMTKRRLQHYFERFGTVVNIRIESSPSPATKPEGGFAIITYSEASAIENVLKVPRHTVYGHIVRVEQAKIRKRINDKNKVFVRKISKAISFDDMQAYFSQFGKVEKVTIYRPRRYGFVTCQKNEVADQVCDKKNHIIKNTTVECEKAWPQVEHAVPTE